uniref:replication initiation protein n=1 Tax=Shewanella gaetbuli TaxID=220752 RepID=UPI003B5B8DA1
MAGKNKKNQPSDDLSFLNDEVDSNDSLNAVYESIPANMDYEPTLVEFGLNTKLPELYRKSHKAIFSLHDQSPHEQNIFNIMNAKMSPTHWESGKSPIYEFTAAELSKWLNIEPKHLGTTLKPAAERLSKRSVGFATEDNSEFEFISIFSKIKYKGAKLTLIPNPLLKDFLMEFSQGYGLINPYKMIKLKRGYSKRIYEFLSRFKEDGTYLYPMKLDNLRKYLGLYDKDGNFLEGKKSLKAASVFISRCIEESIEEINELCSDEIIFFEGETGCLGYTPLKKGRSYVGVKFHYQWLDSKIEMSQESALETIKELEQKRLVKKEKLTNAELDILSHAYIKVGMRDKGIQLIKILQERAAAVHKRKQEQESKSNEQTLLEKIAELETMAPDIGY